MVNSSISDFVSEAATEAGFSAAGIAAVPEPDSAEDYAELRQVEPWIEAGRAGEMEYLKRRDESGRLLRSSLRIALPWARSVIVCAANYNSEAPKSIDPESPAARMDCEICVDRENSRVKLACGRRIITKSC